MRNVLFCALLLAAVSVQPSHSLLMTTKTVETFAATCEMAVALPGTVVNGTVQYQVSGYLKGLVFTAGAVEFDSQDVELSGKEMNVLTQSFTGTATIPATAGGAIVTVSAQGQAANVSGSFTASNVRLGELFSPSYLDVASNTHTAKGKFSTWSPTLTTALDGKIVNYEGTYTIVGLDAANGLADGSGSASVTAGRLLAEEATQATTSSPAGAGLLGLALIGTGGIGLVRRR